MQMMQTFKSYKIPKNNSQSKGTSPPNSRAKATWQNQKEKDFEEEAVSRGTFPIAEQDELLHPVLESEVNLCLALFLWPCHHLQRAKPAGHRDFLSYGQWLLVESWKVAHGSAMAVLLQHVLFGSGMLPEWEQSVLGGRRCFPLEEMPFLPTHEASCIEWAVSNRAWDESNFPDICYDPGRPET